MVRRGLGGLLIGVTLIGTAYAQTPRPFPGVTPPQPSAPRPGPGAEPQRTPPPTPQSIANATPPPAAAARQGESAPTAATLGVALYPTAQYLSSYDAGRGQRYYIFGTTASFADIVSYYRTQLKDGGDMVYKDPPTHMFDVGRFREETMAFPPGVTVKDWTSGGSAGYPNPVPGGQPARFPTIIMIVPPPPAPAAPPRR